MKRVNLVLIAVVFLLSAAVFAVATTHLTPVRAEGGTMRTVIQSLLDNKTRFDIFGGGYAPFVIDGTVIAVSDLGDSYVCISGSGVTSRSSAHDYSTICLDLSGISLTY